jgi:hypothetical protein
MHQPLAAICLRPNIAQPAQASAGAALPEAAVVALLVGLVLRVLLAVDLAGVVLVAQADSGLVGLFDLGLGAGTAGGGHQATGGDGTQQEHAAGLCGMGHGCAPSSGTPQRHRGPVHAQRKRVS